MSEFTYYINDTGLKSWEDWLAEGYLKRLQATEQMCLNIALIPTLVYVGVLMAFWMPGIKPAMSSPSTWFFGWGYLLVSVALLVVLHVRHPKSLSQEARDAAQASIKTMMYHARLHSEIEELTENG
jgi:protein-S-isoprenylcysteine O-methyltransferase Ste14